MTFFPEWLEAQGREATLDELTRPAIREWLAELNETREPSMVKTRYRGPFRFCGWLVDEAELDANPMLKLSPPEARESRPGRRSRAALADSTAVTVNGSSLPDNNDA